MGPTPPDGSDPGVPVVGAGASYAVTANPQGVVTTCRDRLNSVVDLNLCLDAAFSCFMKIATDCVIPKPVLEGRPCVDRLAQFIIPAP